VGSEYGSCPEEEESQEEDPGRWPPGMTIAWGCGLAADPGGGDGPEPTDDILFPRRVRTGPSPPVGGREPDRERLSGLYTGGSGCGS
jgi:hypothetical protein